MFQLLTYSVPGWLYRNQPQWHAPSTPYDDLDQQVIPVSNCWRTDLAGKLKCRPVTCWLLHLCRRLAIIIMLNCLSCSENMLAAIGRECSWRSGTRQCCMPQSIWHKNRSQRVENVWLLQLQSIKLPLQLWPRHTKQTAVLMTCLQVVQPKLPV